MPINQIEIRTEEIDEILGKTPNKIIRWGVTVIFLVIVTLLIGSWFFKYPDKIVSSIEISTLNPPAVVIAKATGKIAFLYVSNNEKVYEGQLLAIIENPADYKNIIQSNQLADSLTHLSTDRNALNLLKRFQMHKMNLGELQQNFSIFVSAYNNLVNFLHLGYYYKKIEAVKRQVSDYKTYYNYTVDQKHTMMSSLELAEKDYQRNNKLYITQTIPEAELDKSKSRYLNKKYAFENIRTSLANIKIQIAQLQSNILDLQLQQKQQQEKLLIDLKGAYHNFKAQSEIWGKRYLLKAPISGLCVFTKFRSKNQNIKVGEKVVTIIPLRDKNIFGRLLLPVRGAGKVKTGQHVNIRLSNYPYMEFGQLEGVITNISSVPSDGFYYVKVKFPNGMTTSYGRNIPFSQNLQGSAEIITNNIRLFYRILQPVRFVLTENTKH